MVMARVQGTGTDGQYFVLIGAVSLWELGA
mgnify:CR=1 FL=1